MLKSSPNHRENNTEQLNHRTVWQHLLWILFWFGPNLIQTDIQKTFFISWIFMRHLHKQIAFTRQMHWVSCWHWPCSDLQTEALFFLPPILCWEIGLACSFIMLHLKCINVFFIHRLDLTSCCSGVWQLAFFLYVYSLQWHASTQHNQIIKHNSERYHYFTTSCYTLCTTSFAAIELLWYEAAIFSGNLYILLFWINR